MRKSTKAEKIQWLLKNKPMWEGLGPWSGCDHLTRRSERLRAIAEAMTREGLYSDKYEKFETHIWNLIADARRFARKSAWASKKT